MKSKDKSFKNILSELEKTSDKTGLMDMESQIKKPIDPVRLVQSSEDYADLISKQAEKRKEYLAKPAKNQVELYKKIQESKAAPISMSQEKNINKISDIIKQADLSDPTDLQMVEKLKKLESKPSPKKISGKGRLGLLASLIGGGIAAIAPESKAAEIVNKISEATSKMDPATYLQEGIDTFDKRFEEMKKKNKEEKELKKLVEPMVKTVGGEPDMNPKKAEKLLGEKDSPDVEEMDNIVNYEDYLKKKKRQFGY